MKKKYTKANSSRGCLTRMDAKYQKIHLPHDELCQTCVCHNICKEKIPWVLIPPNARVMRFKPCTCLNDMLHILKELEHMVLMMPNLKAYYLILGYKVTLQ
jgi:hypothetical protein